MAASLEDKIKAMLSCLSGEEEMKREMALKCVINLAYQGTGEHPRAAHWVCVGGGGCGREKEDQIESDRKGDTKRAASLKIDGPKTILSRFPEYRHCDHYLLASRPPHPHIHTHTHTFSSTRLCRGGSGHY